MLTNPPQNRRGPYLLCLLLVSLLAACGDHEPAVVGDKGESAPPGKEKLVPIAAIVANPADFRNHQVRVAGRASAGRAFEFVSQQPYLLTDNDASIWVVTSGLPPQEGAWITVRGTVASPYQIKGRHYAVAILEDERAR